MEDVADGSHQHTYITIEEATPPKIALEALFAWLLIDAHEGISVQIFDFMGEYIQA